MRKALQTRLTSIVYAIFPLVSPQRSPSLWERLLLSSPKGSTCVSAVGPHSLTSLLPQEWPFLNVPLVMSHSLQPFHHCHSLNAFNNLTLHYSESVQSLVKPSMSCIPFQHFLCSSNHTPSTIKPLNMLCLCLRKLSLSSFHSQHLLILQISASSALRRPSYRKLA